MDTSRGNYQTKLMKILPFRLGFIIQSFCDADSKDKFDWNLYLESQQLEAAPNFAFQHVSRTLLRSLFSWIYLIFFLSTLGGQMPTEPFRGGNDGGSSD